ncbi:MFS transporter [Streptomyces tailanensis]|uniref:MFS transporter n=1 Tax=Streptomyces tailanensis TaxID=2569858 RepID=UPI00122E744C|nr:MFS transporter [Streptomyces tailanensis]
MTSSTAPLPTAAAGLRRWALLAVLAGNMLLDALEVSVLVVAAPAIGADLGLPPQGVQWTMSGFALGFAGLLLYGPQLAERRGRRRTYLVALALFAAASLAGAVATDPVVLVVTRFVKGCCAALTAPMGLAIITSAFTEGPVRRRAVSVYALFGAAGFTVGLPLSGLLTEWDWRWALAFPAPVVTVLFVVGTRVIPRDTPAPGAGTGRPDAAGALLLTGALTALVGGFTLVPADGWTGPRGSGLLLLSVTLFATLGLRERVVSRPLVPASLLRAPGLARAALVAACLNGAYLSTLLTATLHLQWRAGHGPLWTALAFLPASAPLACSALHSGRMIGRFGTRRPIAAGMSLALAGFVLLWHRGLTAPYPTGLLPALLLVGAGFVLAFAALNTQATVGVPDSGKGRASAAYQTAVQAGAALFLALTAALLPSASGPAASAHKPVLTAVVIVAALGWLSALGGLRPGDSSRSPS